MADDAAGMSLATMLEQALADGKVSDEAVQRMLNVLWAYRTAGVRTLVGTELRRSAALGVAHETITDGPSSPNQILLAHEVVDLRAALDALDTMNPDDYRLGQGHLAPAFREVSFKHAFQFVAKTVNKVLHGTDENGNPLPEQP